MHLREKRQGTNNGDMCTWSKQASIVMKISFDEMTCPCNLDYWHCEHCLVHIRTSLLMDGQMYRGATGTRLAAIPGCEKARGV